MHSPDNPYSPPGAAVSSRSAHPGANGKGPRPASVRIALALLGIEILLSAASVTVELGKSSFDPLTLIGPLVGMLNLAVAVVMYRFIARGRNWARIAFLVLWLISFLYQATWIYASVGVAPESVRYAVSWTAVASMALPHLLSLAIVILLFGPGRAWFREPQAD